MATIVSDVTVSSRATIHKIYLILLRRSKAFQWRQNRFEILQHIKNCGEGQWWIQGRGPRGPPPLIFRSKWGPKSRKNFFGDWAPLLISGSGWPPPPPPLSEGLDPPRRGSIYPPLVRWRGVWFCVYVWGGRTMVWLIYGFARPLTKKGEEMQMRSRKALGASLGRCVFISITKGEKLWQNRQKNVKFVIFEISVKTVKSAAPLWGSCVVLNITEGDKL